MEDKMEDYTNSSRVYIKKLYDKRSSVTYLALIFIFLNPFKCSTHQRQEHRVNETAKTFSHIVTIFRGRRTFQILWHFLVKESLWQWTVPPSPTLPVPFQRLLFKKIYSAASNSIMLISLLGREDGWAVKEEAIKATRAANYSCHLCPDPGHSVKGIKCVCVCLGGVGEWSEIQPKCSILDARHRAASSQRKGYLFLICTKMHNG